MTVLILVHCQGRTQDFRREGGGRDIIQTSLQAKQAPTEFGLGVSGGGARSPSAPLGTPLIAYKQITNLRSQQRFYNC